MNTVSTRTLMMVAMYLCFLCATSTAEDSKKINVKNNCTFPVWPAVESRRFPKPQRYQPLLNPGESLSILFDKSWQGRIWGRVGCNFSESSGEGHCESGDCAGKIICENARIVTQVVIEPDAFSVTLESGYNLPMSIVSSSTKEKCGYQECTADIRVVCPTNLQVRNVEGDVIACNGSCDTTCRPLEFESAFRRACPHATPFTKPDLCYSGLYYLLTFCPSPMDNMAFHQN
ncbi:hypothetical protein KI387_008546 [Taxus chinensis]|uniref:Thaumatin-like protein n=1 Tax=Taxus chinensis TaxID=29808 RepID=A0AA38CQT4_TAXCH|nr:hypothetical protein KI387_008546 [Taxus chinensis]